MASHSRLGQHWLVSILLFLCILFAPSLFAEQILLEKQHYNYLTQQKNDFTFLINESLTPLAQNLSQESLQKKVKENEENLLILREKIVSIKAQLTQEAQHIAALQKNFKNLQSVTAPVFTHPDVEAARQKLKMAINLSNDNKILLEDALTLAFRYEAILANLNRKLRLIQAKAQYQQSINRINTEKAQLSQELENLYLQGMKLQQSMHKNNAESELLLSLKKILLNNKNIDLIQSQLSLLELNQHWLDAEFTLKKNPGMSSLEAITEIYRNGREALIKQEENLKQQLHLLRSVSKRFDTSELKENWQKLDLAIKDKINEINLQKQVLEEDLTTQQDALSKQLAMRTHMPDLKPGNWLLLSKQIILMPIKFFNYLKQLFLRVYVNYIWQDWIFRLLFWVQTIIPLMILLSLRIILKKQIAIPVPQRLTARVYRGIMILFCRNMLSVTILTLLWIIFYISDVSYANYALIFSLIGIFIFFHLLRVISSLVLIDKYSYIAEHDLHLFRKISHLLNAGTVITILVVFSHQYPLAMFVQEMFDRLFMLYLLVISFATWRSKELIAELTAPIMNAKKRYIKNFTLLLLIIVPATLLTTAIIGLSGYQNLAWSLGKFQAQFLLLMAAYMLTRGLMIDVLELFSEWMISSLYNGWLWIEAILKPLDKVLRFFLFLVFLFSVGKLIDSYITNFSVINFLLSSANYTVISSPGIQITVISVINFTALVFVFIWLSKWTKEFGYRWLFKQVNDVGIRNSFSVFAQYTIIVIGFFITVRVLGFDFAGLSLILGGLAVGMGFGLRDFASNIIGGLTLLIERPIREGDLITIGEYEGIVEHIGIRATRLCSWDNKEVLIPNAETFNKPFTNWTHQDSIVRTVVPIKVSRLDDPEVVQKILMQAIENIAEILKTPAPQVFLTQIDETLLSFEIKYFINIKMHIRFEIKSKLLFLITKLFKEAGLQPPIPALQVELNNFFRKKTDERTKSTK